MSKKYNNKLTQKSYTLKQKNNLITYKEKHLAISQRDLAIKFGISIGSVNKYISNKKIIKSDYAIFEKNNDDFRKNLLAKISTVLFENELYNWFLLVRSKNKPITNKTLQILALKFAKKLNVINFKASNTWLNSFKTRYKIKSRSICGKENLVNETILKENYKEFFKKLEEYNQRDIYNADETAIFLNAQLRAL